MARHILLTGAGFSRNWGGWLASEAFEYLLGSTFIDDDIRRALWATKESGRGFEDTLAQMQGEYAAHPHGKPEQNLRNLTNAIQVMFADMAAGYDRVDLDPPQLNSYRDIQFSVLSFLHQFDIFYTLNQDTLIEQKCGPFIACGAVGQFHCPGIKKANQPLDVIGHRIELCEPDLPNFHLGAKPYIKLHGSFNWIQDRGIMLVLGGGKAENIKKYPLLTRYHEEFRKDLRAPGTRLMIIGYGFGDPHINQVITEGAADLEIFIIDPLGVDVLDKRDRRAQIIQPAGDLMQRLNPRLVGASRRSLREIFGSDRVEHAKVVRFFRH